MEHLYAILHFFLVKGNKIHLKPFRGNVCLLDLVHGNALSSFVASVQTAGFSEKQKYSFPIYHNRVLFPALVHHVFITLPVWYLVLCRNTEKMRL